MPSFVTSRFGRIWRAASSSAQNRAIEALTRALGELSQATSDRLRGLEDAAAANYFPAALRSERRSRQF